MNKFLYKADDETRFWALWEDYVSRHRSSPRYPRLAIENFLEMSASRGWFASERSFIGLANGIPVALVFLPIEEKEGVRSISFCGSYTIAPLTTDKTTAKAVYIEIDRIAKEERLGKIMFGVDPLERTVTYNILARYAYLDTSILAYLIDLKLPGDPLRHMRRGHRCDIKMIRKNPDFEVFVVDARREDYTLHEEYRELHRKAAGRVTRSKDSFDSQFAKLKADLAALIGVRYRGTAIAYSYFEYNGDKALYGSAADDPEFGHFPLYHVLIAYAIEYLAPKGIHIIEVCQPATPSAQFGYYPDEKMLRIAQFKRGFGGFFTTEYRGIKYMNPNLFRRDVEEFAEKYASSIITSDK